MTARHTTLTLALIAFVALLVSPSVIAQVTQANVVTATATITAIDAAKRQLTLRSEKGEEQVYTAGPEIQRFNELKVGDKVKMAYYESLVFSLRKPGEPAPTPGVQATGERGQGALPTAGAAVQQTQTVTVKAIDPIAPSVTVTTQDGREVNRKIQNKEYLDRVKVGDQIDITYTEALLVGVERAE
jgi:hypothetical protein